MLDLKSWERVAYAVGGNEITFEVRRLGHAESVGLKIMLAQSSAEFQAALTTGTTQLEQATAIRRSFEAMDPEKVSALITKNVRNVGGVTLDGKPITTGEGLYAVADEGLVMHMLVKLREFATLSATQGKGSASPSTSSGEPAGDPSGTSSGSPVLLTASVAGHVSSTAMAISTTPESSTAVA